MVRKRWTWINSPVKLFFEIAVIKIHWWVFLIPKGLILSGFVCDYDLIVPFLKFAFWMIFTMSNEGVCVVLNSSGHCYKMYQIILHVPNSLSIWKYINQLPNLLGKLSNSTVSCFEIKGNDQTLLKRLLFK